MVRSLRLLMIAITVVTTFLHADDDDWDVKQVRKEMYPSFLKGGRQVWRMLYPCRQMPPFFCPPQDGWQKSPDENELKKINMAMNYIQWKSAACLVFFMARPTCRKWAKKLVQNKQNEKDSNQVLNKNNEEEEIVLVGYKGVPLVTFDTCYSALKECGNTLCVARATGLTAGESVTRATVDTTIEMATGITYNAIIYGLCKIVRVLQIQNPFDAENEFYQQMKWIVPHCIKIGIRTLYLSLLNQAQLHNKKTT